MKRRISIHFLERVFPIFCQKSKRVVFRKSISHIIQKGSISNMENNKIPIGFNKIEPPMFPCNNSHKALVDPQAGHGIP